MNLKLILSVIIATQTSAPAFADAPVQDAAFIPVLERIVDQSAESVSAGVDDLTTAGRWALAKIRAARLRDGIDVGAVKAATHHVLTRAGIDLSDADFDRLFLEKTNQVTHALMKGELKLTPDELSMGQSQAALVEGFGAIVIACFSNVVATGVCVAAGGVAVVVGIVIIVQALRREQGPAPAPAPAPAPVPQ